MNLLRTLVELDRKHRTHPSLEVRGIGGAQLDHTMRDNLPAILDALALAESLQEKGQTSPTSAMGVCIASIRERAAQIRKEAGR